MNIFKTNYVKKIMENEAKIAFSTNNIKKLDQISNTGYDLSDLLDFGKHPLLIAVEQNRIPLVIYFLKNKSTNEVIQQAINLSKNNKNLEKILLLHNQNDNSIKDYYKKYYQISKRKQSIIYKNNI